MEPAAIFAWLGERPELVTMLGAVAAGWAASSWYLVRGLIRIERAVAVSQAEAQAARREFHQVRERIDRLERLQFRQGTA